MNESHIELSKEEFIEEVSKADEYNRFIKFDNSDRNMIKSHITKYKSYFTTVDFTNDSALLFGSCFKGHKFNELIYGRIGSTSIKEFKIAKLDDEWYLVEILSYSRDTIGSTKYYKCDQIDGILNLLQGKTKSHKIFNKEEFDKKRVYNSKVNTVIKRIKSMNWEEFDRLYNQIMK